VKEPEKNAGGRSRPRNTMETKTEVSPIMNEATLAVVPPDAGAASEYPLLRSSSTQNLMDIFRENLGSAGVSTTDLQRIKAPTGGAMHWSISTLDGDETAKEIEGIVLAWRTARLYWQKGINEGGGKKPPDCTSRDGFVGVGVPGGDCNRCPMAQFGSAQRGHGQACKQVRQMLLVRPGELLPYLVSIPPTSLKAASQYFLQLAAKGLFYWGVTTKLRLERATNDDGIAYARVTFFVGSTLSPEEQERLMPFHRQMEKILAPVTVDARDYIVEEPANRPAADPEPAFYSGPEKPDDDIPF
jgi:hypothetical protein